jgi:hypothetical protein
MDVILSQHYLLIWTLSMIKNGTLTSLHGLAWRTWLKGEKCIREEALGSSGELPDGLEVKLRLLVKCRDINVEH